MRKSGVILHTYRFNPFLAAFVAAVLVLVSLGVEAAMQDMRLQVAAGALAGKTVVVDAGHGGIDPGASGHGVVEREVVLAVSQDLQKMLVQAGARVIMTRDSKEAPTGKPFRQRRDLTKRAQIANQANADVLISVHANSYPSSPSQRGGQVFVGRGASTQTRHLADLIQEAFRQVTGSRRQVVSGANIFLIQEAKIPAVTVEVGFLSNPQEARDLLNPTYQNKLAWCIFLGLVHYFAGGATPG